MRAFVLPVLAAFTGLLLLTSSCSAQASPPEQWYSFTAEGLLPGMQEKLLTEAVVGYDPSAIVLIDVDASLVAIRSSAAVEPHELSAIASTVGCTLHLRAATGMSADRSMQDDQ
jgi:hypothetical protein